MSDHGRGEVPPGDAGAPEGPSGVETAAALVERLWAEARMSTPAVVAAIAERDAAVRAQALAEAEWACWLEAAQEPADGAARAAACVVRIHTLAAKPVDVARDGQAASGGELRSAEEGPRRSTSVARADTSGRAATTPTIPQMPPPVAPSASSSVAPAAASTGQPSRAAVDAEWAAAVEEWVREAVSAGNRLSALIARAKEGR